jgi:signal transduction histidine kinase/CheY-like chemotaxis protein/ligand-binding sensor domain-containing protein
MRGAERPRREISSRRPVAAATALLLVCAAPGYALAQPPATRPLDPSRIAFDTVAGDYGSIYNVIEDRDGFLWLAGIDGAKKYNGYTAETVHAGETVSALFQDSEGLIWMVVRSGVSVHDKRTGKTTRHVPRPDVPGALSGESFVAYQKTQLLTEDRDGRIWIATRNGLNRFDKRSGKFTAYRSRPGDAATLLDDDVWSVLTARDGSLWVGTATGLQRFDPTAGKVLERYPADADDPDALHGRRVQATVEDDEGAIWAGTTEAGLSRLDPRTRTFSHYRADEAGPHRIADNFIYRLAHLDSAPELIWIATVGGLSILNKRHGTVTSYVYGAQKGRDGALGGKIVHTIIQDRAGVLWVVVDEHGFLQRIDPGAHQFQRILRSQDPREGFVDVSCPLRLGPDGRIWVTEVTSGIARVDPTTGRIVDHLLHDPQRPGGFPASIEDFDFEPRRANVIWVVAKGVVVEYDWRARAVIARHPSGTRSKIWPVWTDKRDPDLLYGAAWGEGLFKFDKRTGRARILAPDPARPKETLSGTGGPRPVLPEYHQAPGNQIWLFTPGVGFDLLDLDTEKVVRKHLFGTTDFTSTEFESAAGRVDSKGRLWIGHNRYDRTAGTFTSFRSLYGHGAPSPYVSSLAEDPQRGLLWGAGFLNGTLVRLDPETGRTKTFTVRDGLSPGLACSCPPVTLPDGQIWMAGSGGVTFFHPDAVVDNPYRPPVHLARLTQGGRPVELGTAPELVRELTLTWDHNFFEFQMVGLSYRHPEANQYRYMLEGVDKEWYEAGTRREGRYSGLPSGTYTLRVLASNNDGVWGDQEATLRITVTPPWWGTWWFRGAGLAALVSLAFAGYRTKVRSIKQRSRELQEKVAERTLELRQAKDDADQARESAERANRAKSTFLANMSHELRTPLNAVLGFSQLMRGDRHVTAEQKEYLDIINRSGEHLLDLINNVLEISRIESGRVGLEEGRLDLHELLQELKSLMYVRAAAKGLELSVAASPDLPRHVVVDGGKVRQVLINLVGNAIKYSARGGVAVRAMRVKQLTAERALVRFEVADSGPGIAERDRERIFAPFVQLGDRPPVEPGAGLGLAICRQHVELMRGRIGVTSEVGKGSVFHFEIPVAELPPEAIPGEPRRGRVLGQAPGQARHRILVTEDHPENRLLLRKLLDDMGFEVREAVDGQEAIAVFEAWSPHLIFMDVRMPVVDGLQATRRIKATGAGARTKIVAITAHALEEERREILAAGCDDFVRKPYRDVEISGALTKHLGVRFVYEDDPPPTSARGSLDAAALAALPRDVLSALEQALIRLDRDAVSRTIERIRADHPELAEPLATMARDLQFGQIFRLIRSLRGSGG